MSSEHSDPRHRHQQQPVVPFAASDDEPPSLGNTALSNRSASRGPTRLLLVNRLVWHARYRCLVGHEGLDVEPWLLMDSGLSQRTCTAVGSHPQPGRDTRKADVGATMRGTTRYGVLGAPVASGGS